MQFAAHPAVNFGLPARSPLMLSS